CIRDSAWADHGGALEDGAVVWRGLALAPHASISVTFGVTVTCVPSGTLIVNDNYFVTATEWLTPTTGASATTSVVAEETVADFAFAPSPVLARWPVYFENLSRNAVRYAWNFGDGTTSAAAQPSHTYAGRGTYTVTLTARNDCQQATITRPLAVEDYAVVLTSPVIGQNADPGQVVTYMLQLTNTGTLSDVIHLDVGGTTWGTVLFTDTVALAPGESASVGLAVTVPANARAYERANVWVKAVSQSDPRTPAAQAAIVLTATVNAVYDLALSASVSEQEARPGATVTYTLLVTNTGNALDTITITRTNAGWPTGFSWTARTIAAGGWRTVQVYVTVPEDVGWGAVDQAIIRAAGQGVAREVTLLTFLPPQRIYLPLVWRGQP
ncbi:MAG: PKD domain-containing protein, partial [Anaerolineae bacterium]|nr:PKD domain-containing protein [Anaerolineae bacterium]